MAAEKNLSTSCFKAYDIRPSSPSLAAALACGLNEGGADVLDLGLCGTEEVYFPTFHYQLDGGIMITASHNPGNYNGMKLVCHESRPLNGEINRRLANHQKTIAAVEKHFTDRLPFNHTTENFLIKADNNEKSIDYRHHRPGRRLPGGIPPRQGL